MPFRCEAKFCSDAGQGFPSAAARVHSRGALSHCQNEQIQGIPSLRKPLEQFIAC
jgi:hypothetical protein